MNEPQLSDVRTPHPLLRPLDYCCSAPVKGESATAAGSMWTCLLQLDTTSGDPRSLQLTHNPPNETASHTSVILVRGLDAIDRERIGVQVGSLSEQCTENLR